MHVNFLGILLEGRFGFSISGELPSDARWPEDYTLGIKAQESTGKCPFYVEAGNYETVLVA